VPIDFDDQSAERTVRPQVLHLDPWIVFWQIFEDRREAHGDLQAAIVPFGPAVTGVPVVFAAECPPPTADGERCEFYWTFGDGVLAMGSRVSHVFADPGVYPVTLVIDDGVRRAAKTQHIAISGSPVDRSAMALSAPDEPAFRNRPLSAMDIYGRPPQLLPQTLTFLARMSRPQPALKTVRVENTGTGELGRIEPVEIAYESGADWLRVAAAGTGNEQDLTVSVDASGLEAGAYAASVRVACPGALNSPQRFRVEFQVSERPDTDEIVVDNVDRGFYATPYFWVGHRFSRCPRDRRGYAGFYLTTGGRATAGEFARFTPDLQAGRYEVAFSDKTPFAAGVEFDVRIRHAAGEQTIRVRPDQSRKVGVWDFLEGTDGYIEILAEHSRGLVIADAVVFRHTD
jgi:hypothetical protein